MAKIYEQREHKVIDESVRYATVTALAASETLICSMTLKTGVKPKLVKFGNIVSAGGEGLVKFTLYVNGVPHPDYFQVMNMKTDPSNPEAQNSFERELQQGAFLEVKALNTDPADDFDVTANVVVYYEDPR